MKLKPETLPVSNGVNATMVEADISAVWCNFNVHFGYSLPQIFPHILLTSVFIAMLAQFWANCSALASVLRATLLLLILLLKLMTGERCPPRSTHPHKQDRLQHLIFCEL